jgi:type IV secretion system protein VirD4
MRKERLIRGLLAFALGSTVATQVLAYQLHYAPVLGTPMLHAGIYNVYLPTQGWQWASWWGWSHPGTFTTAGLVLVGITAGLTLLPARKPPQEPDSATWATPRQIRKAKLLRKDGVVLGKLGSTMVRHQTPGHVLVVASTQSGKTSGCVVPTILDDDHQSMVILDPKDEGAVVPGGEVYQVTAGYRATFSKVIRFQPLSPTSHQYNPLASIRLRTPYEMRDLQMVADLLVDPDGNGADHQSDAGQHFSSLASDVHVGVLAHGLYTGLARTLGQCYRLWCGNLQLTDLVQAMESTRHVNGQCHPAVMHAARLIKETAEKELSSLVNTARRALRLWADPLVCRATERSDFTLKDVREGARPLTAYVSFPFSDVERTRGLSRMLMRQLLEHAASRKTGWHYPLLAILDEFQSLRRLPILRHGLNYFLGMGVTMCLMTPSLNEIEDIWGTHHPFLEGCSTQVVFGVRDPQIADRFAKRVGMTKTEHARESWSEATTGFGKRKTTSTETRDEPLVSSTAVMGLDEGTVLAMVGRHAMRLQKARYWEHTVWHQRSQMPVPAPRGRP